MFKDELSIYVWNESHLPSGKCDIHYRGFNIETAGNVTVINLLPSDPALI